MVAYIKLILIGLCLNILKTNWGEGQPIDLTSSFLAEEKQSICVGETVVFTCSVTAAGILTWRIDPYVNINQNPIRFRVRDSNVQVGYTIHGRDGLYNATVTGVSPDPVNDLLGNLSSELHIVVEPGQRIKVLCTDDTTGSQTVTMPPAEPPSSPRNLSFSIESYGISTYSLRAKWEAPSEYGGAEIHNYILTMRLQGMTNEYIATFQTKQLSVTTLFLYNHLYELSIAAENCNGISENSSIIIMKVSCGRLSPPANGFIEPYNSTQEGAEVQYHCDEGHTPREWRTSQCQENGTWAPDPALLNCVKVSCGRPSPPANGSIEPYNSTQEGAEVQYHCDEGHTPREWRTSQCQENGTWAPDPALLNCAYATCVTFELPKEAVVTVNGTTEGSRMRITCPDGMDGVDFVCNKHGQWYPDPAEYGCRDHDIHPDDFNATTIVLTNVATAAIIFCLGVVTGAVMCVCCRKLQCGIRRKQRIPPKDIELRR